MFLSIAAGGALLSLLAPGDAADTPSGRIVTLVIGVVTFHGAGLLLVAWFIRHHGLTWSQAFGFREPNIGRALGLAAFVAALVLPIAWGLNQVSALLLQSVHVDPQVQHAVKTFQQASSLSERLLFGLFAVGLAPVVEELLFRGILYPFIKQAGFPRLAFWGTSVLFGLTHANLMTLLPLAVLAALLVLLYEKTGNLLAPIFTHALFNFVNLIWLLNETHIRRWLEIS